MRFPSGALATVIDYLLRRFASASSAQNPDTDPDIPNTWITHDMEQVGTPYWDRITNPANSIQQKLTDLLQKYRIECVSSHEYIMHPDDALTLIDDLDALGVAVDYVGAWCYGPPEKRYPGSGHWYMAMGGPGRDGHFWGEYVHLGYVIPDWGNVPKEGNLAEICNPLARDYIVNELPNAQVFNEYTRVSLTFYMPRSWDVFPGWRQHIDVTPRSS